MKHKQPKLLCTAKKSKMSIKLTTNTSFLPNFDEEGVFLRPINVCDIDKNATSPHKRLFCHQTLSSVRKYAYYRIPKAPIDSLDFILQSTYNHSKELFPDKEDTYLQKETLGECTWRRLKNTKEIIPPEIVPLGHPLIIGGIQERRVRDNIKLMNSSQHSAKTAPGYSRQPAGGTIFFY